MGIVFGIRPFIVEGKKTTNRDCINAIIQAIIEEPRCTRYVINSHIVLPALERENWKVLVKTKLKVQKVKYQLKVFDCIPYEGKLRVRIVFSETKTAQFIKIDTSGDLYEVLEKRYHKLIKV